MAAREELAELTKTAKNRRRFYCYLTNKFVQDQAVFYLVVEAFKRDRKKRQAAFINDFFIMGHVPPTLQARGYMGEVNISQKLQSSISTATTSSIAAIGQNFAAKAAKHGGGVGGFFGALAQKTIGTTSLSPDLFKVAQDEAIKMLSDRSHELGIEGGKATFRKDQDYQPNGSFAGQVTILKALLKTNGFDPDDLGVF